MLTSAPPSSGTVTIVNQADDHTSRRRPSRRITAALALILLIVAVVYVRSRGGGGLHDWDDGPLHAGSVTQNSIPVDVNQPFTFGQATVNNITDKTAILDALRVVPELPGGMEIIEVAVVGPNRETALVASELAYPSPYLVDVLRPLPGAQVPPEDTKAGEAGVEIVFGLKVTKPGVYGFPAFDLDYHIGSTDYTVRVEHGFMACAPRADFPDGCDHDFLDDLADQIE